MKPFRQKIISHFEWLALLTGLVLLSMMDPDSTGKVSLCFFDWLGVYCPGEGLGHSIAYIFRGEWSDAWQAHPAGYMAVTVLSSRIIYLFRQKVINKEKPNFHSDG